MTDRNTTERTDPHREHNTHAPPITRRRTTAIRPTAATGRRRRGHPPDHGATLDAGAGAPGPASTGHRGLGWTPAVAHPGHEAHAGHAGAGGAEARRGAPAPRAARAPGPAHDERAGHEAPGATGGHGQTARRRPTAGTAPTPGTARRCSPGPSGSASS